MIKNTEGRTERITCEAPGIRNHNGSPKPVATLTDEGIWVFCRWSREMEFITREKCLAFWGFGSVNAKPEISEQAL